MVELVNLTPLFICYLGGFLEEKVKNRKHRKWEAERFFRGRDCLSKGYGEGG
jgi:hypothetical protein